MSFLCSFENNLMYHVCKNRTFAGVGRCRIETANCFLKVRIVNKKIFAVINDCLTCYLRTFTRIFGRTGTISDSYYIPV